MTHARPFWTSTFQDLSNGRTNTSMQGVLTPVIESWVFGSLGGLPSPIFGSVSGDLTPPSKWGCDIIFNRNTYTQWVDGIISYKFSSFSIRDVAFWSMFPTPQTLKPNTCNNCFEVNLTNIGFRNGRHCFAKITSLSHSCYALAWMWLTTFWSFHLCMAMAFPKIRAFILTWSWCRRPPTKVESFPSLAFFIIKPCTSFKCLVNNHLAQYATMQVPTLHFHFDPTFILFLSFRAKLVR